MDLEKEYNNRARVPDFDAIYNGWLGEAQNYRDNSNCETGLAYGEGGRQQYDLFWPEKQADPKGPMVVFVHGGYWKSLGREVFSHLAGGANGHGLPVIMPSYSLCPNAEIMAIIEEIRLLCAHVWRKFERKCVIAGHSAGGHLAAAMLATDWREFGFQESPVVAGFSVSGIFDLRPLLAVSVNEDLQLDEDSAFQASPLLWKGPAGGIFESWVGGDESNEFIRQSSTIEAVWQGLGIACRHVTVPDRNHFTIIEELTSPDSDMSRTLAGLAQNKK